MSGLRLNLYNQLAALGYRAPAPPGRSGMPYLVMDPPLAVVVPGTKIKYTIKVNPVITRQNSSGFKFKWWARTYDKKNAINELYAEIMKDRIKRIPPPFDPNKPLFLYSELHLYLDHGPDREITADNKDASHRRIIIICEITDPNGKIEYVQYIQQVRFLRDLMVKHLYSMFVNDADVFYHMKKLEIKHLKNQSYFDGRDLKIEYLEKFVVEMENKFKFPFYFDTEKVRDYYSSKLFNEIMPLKTLIMSPAYPIPISVPIYARNTHDGAWQIFNCTNMNGTIDIYEEVIPFSPGIVPDITYTYTGIKMSWDKFIKEARLPKGRIITEAFDFEGKKQYWEGEITRNYMNTTDEIVAWLSGIGFVAGILACILTGGYAIPFIIMAAGANIGAASLSLYDRFEHGTLYADARTVIDVFSIAGSLFSSIVTFAVKIRNVQKLGKLAEKLQAGKKMVYIHGINTGVDIGIGMVISFDQYIQIRTIAMRGDLSRERRQQLIFYEICVAIVTGGFAVVGVYKTISGFRQYGALNRTEKLVDYLNKINPELVPILKKKKVFAKLEKLFLDKKYGGKFKEQLKKYTGLKYKLNLNKQIEKTIVEIMLTEYSAQTVQHQKQVAQLCEIVAEGMQDYIANFKKYYKGPDADELFAVVKQYKMTPQEIHDLVYAGKIHDWGKLGVRDSFLNSKINYRDNPEFAKKARRAFAKHPGNLIDIVNILEIPINKKALDWAYKHHMSLKYGKGYPYKWKGRFKLGPEMTKKVEIIAFCDTFQTAGSKGRKGGRSFHQNEQALASLAEIFDDINNFNVKREGMDPRIVKAVQTWIESNPKAKKKLEKFFGIRLPKNITNRIPKPKYNFWLTFAGEFKNNKDFQKKTFKLAKEWLKEQNDFMKNFLKQNNIKAEHRNILKRDNLKDFVAGINEKCKRKDYVFIHQMDDIVRGRINTKSCEDVNLIFKELKKQTKYKVIHHDKPRRPIAGKDNEYGYPRYHVILQDTVTKITHEWQIGTKAVTEVFETKGIKIPTGLTLKQGMKNDLHDIEYDIFKPIQDKHIDIASNIGILEFRKKVDSLAGKAGKFGDSISKEQLKREIKELHNEASIILQKLYDQKGADFIKGFYH